MQRNQAILTALLLCLENQMAIHGDQAMNNQIPQTT